MKENLFQDIFVFDLANNHQGQVDHGKKIISAIGEKVKKWSVNGVMKFQYRQLETFIHPDHQQESDEKYVQRFQGTRLTQDDNNVLFKAANSAGLQTMCTPFDEESVDVIVDTGFDYIKVASCSAKDWPLLEKIATATMPVVFSTGGLELSDIDNLVSFFEHRGIPAAIMHCVSIYPTPPEACHLNHIDLLLNRYRKHTIGWSTHENPNDTAPVMIAMAKGARMFERHVGMVTDQISLNAYSSTPEQVDNWLGAYVHAKNLCGSKDGKVIDKNETKSLQALSRGVYAKRDIDTGARLNSQDVYFAMPFKEGQLASGEWSQTMTVKQAINTDEPVFTNQIEKAPISEFSVLKTAIHEIKALLNEARVELNSEFDLEFSHHYGKDKFPQIGTTIINCINREYCKKILVQLPGQKHPAHFHKRKEETFQILYGVLESEIDGLHRTLYPGQTVLIQPGTWHNFWSDSGCVFEEVSTTHFNNDSVYNDRVINNMDRSERKTQVTHWGRFEMVDEF
jgi:N-acetylneuraminate synthase